MYAKALADYNQNKQGRKQNGMWREKKTSVGLRVSAKRDIKRAFLSFFFFYLD